MFFISHLKSLHSNEPNIKSIHTRDKLITALLSPVQSTNISCNASGLPFLIQKFTRSNLSSSSRRFFASAFMRASLLVSPANQFKRIISRIKHVTNNLQLICFSKYNFYSIRIADIRSVYIIIGYTGHILTRFYLRLSKATPFLKTWKKHFIFHSKARPKLLEYALV